MNNEERIFDYYVIFCSNSINHSLTLFLPVLIQYFIFDLYKTLRKSKYLCIFIFLYVCIDLDEKLIDLFRKNIVANIMVIKNLTK